MMEFNAYSFERKRKKVVLSRLLKKKKKKEIKKKKEKCNASEMFLFHCKLWKSKFVFLTSTKLKFRNLYQNIKNNFLNGILL